ncbi:MULTISPECIES: sensor histidine kinase [Catenuloplanes]|uniref:Sensor-like histidine kinase SenX3 n=1 Tax=Catenuloplanes niger TaxID=587534 RepID=A0AAE4CWR6_9ACTN|nr:ATP-binding protein [Catenuloplanes niger]MDR7327475.1 PAS domain S-box-containing protein [Catenuloplanes niger]
MVATAAGALAIALGAALLAGWDVLLSAPGMLSRTQPGIAATLIALGLGLPLLATATTSPGRVALTRVVTLAGLLTAALALTLAVGGGHGSRSGQIVIAASLLLTAAAQAAVAVLDGQAPTVAHSLLGAAACLCLVTCFGYLFAAADGRYGEDPVGAFGAAALPEAAGLGLVVLGTLVARPREGMLGRLSVSGPESRRLVRALAVVLAGTLTVTGAAIWLGLDRFAPLLTGLGVASLIGFGLYAAWAVARMERARADARQEAAASHSQLLKLIDNTKSNIYMKRIDNGQYILVNREWERLFGVRREEVINLTDHGVFAPELADRLRTNDLDVARAGTTVQYEETADSADGLRTYISVKFPVLDSNGEPYAVCGISTDITDRKQAEEQVRRLNTELEKRVRERTAELEASTRELDAFAYSISHDLRAPLRSLHGFSEALLEDYGDVLDDTGKDYLSRLQRNVRRMGRMIDDLLNLSRATRVELAREVFDLTAMAKDIGADLSEADPGRSVRLSVADDLTLYGDPHLVRLALQNLLANAWKFTGRCADPAIEVGRCQRGGEDLIFVRDNGAGFDMQYADKLFNAFQRLHSTADFEGTGIGLAIVARVVRRHGGLIFAEAEPGRGATFYFNLMSEREA